MIYKCLRHVLVKQNISNEMTLTSVYVCVKLTHHSQNVVDIPHYFLSPCAWYWLKRKPSCCIAGEHVSSSGETSRSSATRSCSSGNLQICFFLFVHDVIFFNCEKIITQEMRLIKEFNHVIAMQLVNWHAKILS